MTCTVVDELTDPPVPMQVNVNVVFDERGPTSALPEVGLEPDQPLLAWQLDALVDDQFRTVESPESMTGSDALSTTIGKGGGGPLTVTVTEAASLPPLPEHVSVKVCDVVRLPVDSDPAVAREPVQNPLATHALALTEDQFSVVASPESIVGFTTLRVVIGAGSGLITLTLAVVAARPPKPTHCST